MTHANPEAITKSEMLARLDKLYKRIEQDDVAKAYIIFTDKTGEHWDHAMGYGLVELTGVLETAKHMQLQGYVRAQLEGMEYGRSAEEIAERIHNMLSEHTMEKVRKLKPEAADPLTWKELDQEEQATWIAIVREAIGE